ncbi:MAG: winged helix-turn-helix transcriptional regulator [Methanobacteriota archaeon]
MGLLARPVVFLVLSLVLAASVASPLVGARPDAERPSVRDRIDGARDRAAEAIAGVREEASPSSARSTASDAADDARSRLEDARPRSRERGADDDSGWAHRIRPEAPARPEAGTPAAPVVETDVGARIPRSVEVALYVPSPEAPVVAAPELRVEWPSSLTSVPFAVLLSMSARGTPAPILPGSAGPPARRELPASALDDPRFVSALAGPAPADSVHAGPAPAAPWVAGPALAVAAPGFRGVDVADGAPSITVAAAVGALAIPAWALYRRIMKDRVLEVDVRRRLLEEIRRRPGGNVRELALAVDVHYTTAQHHVRVLAEADLIGLERIGGRVRCFVNAGAYDARERTVAGLAATATTRRILTAIRDAPGSDPASIARAAGAPSSTTGWNLRRLEAAGVAVRRRDRAERRERWFLGSGVEEALARIEALRVAHEG